MKLKKKEEPATWWTAYRKRLNRVLGAIRCLRIDPTTSVDSPRSTATLVGIANEKGQDVYTYRYRCRPREKCPSASDRRTDREWCPSTTGPAGDIWYCDVRSTSPHRSHDRPPLVVCDLRCTPKNITQSIVLIRFFERVWFFVCQSIILTDVTRVLRPFLLLDKFQNLRKLQRNHRWRASFEFYAEAVLKTPNFLVINKRKNFFLDETKVTETWNVRWSQQD